MSEEKHNTVLVTGGRGFLGRGLVKLLQRTGYRVVSVDQSPVENPTKEPTGEEIQLDITDASALGRLFEEESFDAIVHLAAILPTAAQADPVLATKVNVAGSMNLLECARRFAIERFVFGSSLSVYGSCPADQQVSETHRAAPEDVYGAAKLYVEQVGEAYRQQHGIQFASLRIGRVVGPGAQSSTSAWRSQIFEFLNAKRLVEIALPYAETERLLLIHVEDAAAMLAKLVESPALKFSIYNSVCEAVVVDVLKRKIETLNPNVHVKTGNALAAGNPRWLDCSRFQREFDFQATSIFERLEFERRQRSVGE